MNATHVQSSPRRRRRIIATTVIAGALLAGGSVGLTAASAAPAAVPTPVNLGAAAPFAVLAAATVTNTGHSVLNGDLGVSPGTALTGFPPGRVNGTKHSADRAAARAQADLTRAYNDAASRRPTANLTGQDLGGKTLAAGIRKFSSSVGLTGTLTLDGRGNPASVFIFQIGSTLTTASASKVRLINGAHACHVYWQVGSSATLGTTTAFVGTVMALASITATTGVTVKGRLLARTAAVTLDTNTVTRPTCT